MTDFGFNDQMANIIQLDIAMLLFRLKLDYNILTECFSQMLLDLLLFSCTRERIMLLLHFSSFDVDENVVYNNNM